eukprot:291064_1
MVRSYSWKVLLTILVLLASNQLNVDGADQSNTGSQNEEDVVKEVQKHNNQTDVKEQADATDSPNDLNVSNQVEKNIESNDLAVRLTGLIQSSKYDGSNGSQNDVCQSVSNVVNEVQQQIIEKSDDEIQISERSDSNDSLYKDMGSINIDKDLIGGIGQGHLNDSQNDGGLTNGSSSQDTIMNELVDIIEKALLEKNDDKEDSSKSLSPDGNDEKRQKVQENVDDSIHSTQDSDNNQKVSEEVNEIKSQNRKTDVQEKQGDSNDGQDEYKEEIGNKNANQQKNVIVAQDDNVGLHNMTCVLLMLGVIAFVLAVTRLHKPILNWGSLLLAGAVGIGSTIYMNKRRWGGKVSSDYICFVVLFLLLIFVLFMCGFHRDTPNSVDWDKRFKFVDASSPDKILHESASIASCPSHVVYALVTTVMLNALFGWI